MLGYNNLYSTLPCSTLPMIICSSLTEARYLVHSNHPIIAVDKHYISFKALSQLFLSVQEWPNPRGLWSPLKEREKINQKVWNECDWIAVTLVIHAVEEEKCPAQWVLRQKRLKINIFCYIKYRGNNIFLKVISC